ncbi:hypothetical protein [Streptomyces sp. NBC_01462]|uniref:hypothetical protein n=1 Tax=Streptomyces sp. NBC_01462 TaxID=2903876 RepID=UPI002E32637D|nr:hypothetical protein [Streptomyces sp. NBC_01462]
MVPKKQAARVLTQDQLEQAVVNEHDLPGLIVTKIGVGTDGLGDGVVKAFPDRDTHPGTCGPVSGAVDGGSSHTPVGSVLRIARSKGSTVMLYLVSYQEEDAARVIDELRASLRTCKAFTAGPMKVAYQDVRATDEPSLGGEGLSSLSSRPICSPGTGRSTT